MNRVKSCDRTRLLLLVIVLSLSFWRCGQEEPANPTALVSALPGATVTRLAARSPFREEFEILLRQPLDHWDSQGEEFSQRILLSHVGRAAPVVLVTEGYAVGHNYIRELCEILGANQIRVEHRFFGLSKPNSPRWKYLNLKQASADYHRIKGLFKKFYKGRWLSAGWSKGGQTALSYRYYYPDDVTATAAYDAPVNFALEDPRIDAFFAKVGSEYCRRKLIEFQRRALENKSGLLPLFRGYSRQKGYCYSIGEEKAFEYVVLEYPFSFWQYKKIDCALIPGKEASVEEMFDHLKDVVAFSSYSDRALDSPAMYQFATELGYYGYVQEHVEDLLSGGDYKNTAFAPRDATLVFRPEIMAEVNHWLQNRGDRILYIYGGRDPWSAPAVELAGKTDVLHLTLPEGNHFTFIRTFSEPQQQRIVTTLAGWLDWQVPGKNIPSK